MSTNILSIPAELQKEIAACVEDDHDIIQLRQTCREMCAATHDTFVERFFTKRTILYTKQSLQELHDISQQRHLAAKLRFITFITLATHSIADANPPPRLALDYMHFCQCVYDATQYGEDDTSILIQILDNLGMAGSRPEFLFLEQAYYSHSRLAKLPGLSKLSDRRLKTLVNEAIISPGSWMAARQSSYCPVSDLSRASASSKYAITGLRFANYGPSIFSHGAQMSAETLSRSWSSLKYLSIPLEEEAHWPKMHTQLPRFLKAATALKKLALHFPRETDWVDRGHILRLLSAATVEPELCSISIIGYMSNDHSSQDLLSFLRNHRKSLKHLNLRLVGWPDENSFYNFIESIASDFSFDSVELEKIDIDPDSDTLVCVMVNKNGGSYFSFRNKETIPAELCKLRGRTFFSLGEEPDEEEDEEEEEEDDSDGSIVGPESISPLYDQDLLTGEDEDDYYSEDDDDTSDEDQDEWEEEVDEDEQTESWELAFNEAVASEELVNIDQEESTADEKTVQQMLEEFE